MLSHWRLIMTTVADQIMSVSAFEFSRLTDVKQVRILGLIRRTFHNAVYALEKSNGGFTTWQNAWEWFVKTHAYHEALKGIDPNRASNKPIIRTQLIDGKQHFIVETHEQTWLVRPSVNKGIWEAAQQCGDFPEIIDPTNNANSPVKVIRHLTGVA